MDFKLDNNFIEKYINIDPGFGFNGLGKLTYYRTYSRLKEDGTNEEWFETIRRVVEGTYSIQKRHILKYNLGWEEGKAQESAQEMYDRMFKMKFLPPGRGLWAMGSDIIEKKELFAALNNCGFVSTENLDIDLTKPFEFLMDMSMVGVGIGFDVKGAGKITILKPHTDILVYEIPDTRQGWVESVKMALNAFFKGDPIPTFDYSKIRPKGELIKTFGGKASGPVPLEKLHNQIIQMFDGRHGQTITITDITDIMNMIGVCVVAGNVRRSAEIVFGDGTNSEFLNLKDYIWDNETMSYKGSNAKRAEYGWTSNNSVFAELGMDYSKLAKQTAKNGEPGYAWLDNMQDYGRLSDGFDDRDFRVKGGNPCLEQSLEPWEMCCLVETFPTRADDEADYLRTLKFAYLYGKTVTLGTTDWVETNRVQLRNRRIGTSISGITQYITNKGIHNFINLMNRGYDVLKYYDEVYSNWLAVPKSIKMTSIKPSGTISLLPGVTPGMHFPESNFYIRRMRLSSNSDLLPSIYEAGYHVEPDVTAPNDTLVVEIPVAIKGVRTTEEVSMWEQLELAALIQYHWSDNQVSCTVTFTDKEKDQIEHALNYFQYRLKGISFLPKLEKGSYAQMPYEKITEEKYNELIKDIKNIDIKRISVQAEPDKYCDNDSCVI
jgi:adenosylcobalamin-dependent ribonucleoside-triphosphate reductase